MVIEGYVKFDLGYADNGVGADYCATLGGATGLS